ncbi:ATP-binding cassette domain-containing protein [Cardiobacteriales bacterium ML27]|uniref:ATP-binding cassette domain-containing protein n=2 Tax=Ostreibacterium oceani TaxID=2654998 RepID=A0A6N7EVA0_9GAMM|nr:ATP-binding cassette domain-containing protein [Ostreibacterium oceani]
MTSSRLTQIFGKTTSGRFMPDAPILACQQWALGYDAPTVLSGINWQLAAQSIVALVGQNGVGKSSFLKSIMGLMPAVQGDCYFQGQSLAKRKTVDIARLDIAYVPQDNAVFNQLTVAEHFALVNQLPIEVNLQHFPQLQRAPQKLAGKLSGGQRQQLAIAFALASSPLLLLLDEPSANIQPSIVEQLTETLSDIHQQTGLAIILAEQNLSMISQLANTAYLIEPERFIETPIPIDTTDPKQLSEALSSLSSLSTLSALSDLAGHQTGLTNPAKRG